MLIVCLFFTKYWELLFLKKSLIPYYANNYFSLIINKSKEGFYYVKVY